MIQTPSHKPRQSRKPIQNSKPSNNTMLWYTRICPNHLMQTHPHLPWPQSFTHRSHSEFPTALIEIDDTLGVFHTHAVAGSLGGLLTGLLAEPSLCKLILPTDTRGAFYGGNGGEQFAKQIVAAFFIIAWNIASTSTILLFIRLFLPLRMPDHQLEIGDDAVHGEEAYALWGDGEKYDPTKHAASSEVTAPSTYVVDGSRGVTISL